MVGAGVYQPKSYNYSRLILSSLSSPAWKEIPIWRYVFAFLQAASLKSSLGTKGRTTSCWKCFSVAYLTDISQLATWILKLVFCNPLAHILFFFLLNAELANSMLAQLTLWVHLCSFVPLWYHWNSTTALWLVFHCIWKPFFQRFSFSSWLFYFILW